MIQVIYCQIKNLIQHQRKMSSGCSNVVALYFTTRCTKPTSISKSKGKTKYLKESEEFWEFLCSKLYIYAHQKFHGEKRLHTSDA
jgi:hypothetical protein